MRMWNIFADEAGQSTVEYGLILSLLSIVAIGVLIVLGPKIEKLYSDASGKLDQVPGAAQNAG